MLNLHRWFSSAKIAFYSTSSLLPVAPTAAYQYISPKTFALEQSPKILKSLGAGESLLKINQVASKKMIEILESEMVQRMAQGTVSSEEWDKRYMKADALYIYNLGKALAERAAEENEQDRENVMLFAKMFLGYGKHIERLKKYDLSEKDILVSPECDRHIDLLSKQTSINEFYFALLTDMIPYVIFANYLLHSIGVQDDNHWKDYAQKYGNLENKYAKEKLGKAIRIANEILRKSEVNISTAEKLILKGFTFEEWFIRNAFSNGFNIYSTQADKSK